MKTALLFARAYLAGYLIGVLLGCATHHERCGTTTDGNNYCVTYKS